MSYKLEIEGQCKDSHTVQCEDSYTRNSCSSRLNNLIVLCYLYEVLLPQ